MKKWLVLGFVLVFAGGLYAAGDLLRTPGNFINQAPIQQICPTSVAVKSIGTKNAFVNFTTTTLTAISYQGLNGDTAQNMRVRVGGFTNKTSFGYVVNSSGTIWIGQNVNKVGFSCISSAAPGTKVSVQKM